MSENTAIDNKDNVNDLSKIKNVKVKLYAELGRTNISVKEAVEFDNGSVIALDKLENEPVDIFVDDILIAKATIVAVEDTYGIKIVELIESKDKQN